MDLTVRNIPDPVYRTIKQEARQNGRSLNAEIIRTLELEASEIDRRRNLRAVMKQLERFRSALPLLDDSAPLIRRDRER